MNIKNTVANNIARYRNAAGITQKELANMLGTTGNTISNWENGVSSLDIEMLIKVADILLVNVNDMYGSMKYTSDEATATQSIPILGNIAAGNPIVSEQHILETVEVSSRYPVDLGFIVSGDSMIGDHILPGDYVFIKKQPIVSDGDICAVLIDSEITLKHFQQINEKQVMFISSNPAYKPIVCDAKSCPQVQIIGKYVKLERYNGNI